MLTAKVGVKAYLLLFKTMKIFLDDIRIPKDCISYMYTRIGKDNHIYLDDWIIVRNYKEFVDVVSNHIGDITHISFDHDLADNHYNIAMDWEAYYNISKDYNEYTGYDCAKWLVDAYAAAEKSLPIIYVHSMNPIGRERIEKLFK